jgi:hypothetical protein
MRARSNANNDLAVSEVIGVVMLLAMVISMMGGVFLVLSPYVNDFQDNSAYAAANGIAERVDERIELVSGANSDVGIRATIEAATSSITPITQIETWFIAADLTPQEQVSVDYINSTSFTITAQNESATNAHLWTPSGEQEFSFESTNLPVLLTHNLSVHTLWIMTISDSLGNVIHKSAYITISGLQITTNVQQGDHNIALVNDARYEKFSGKPWAVTEKPDLEIEELHDGTMRASLRLRDVSFVGPIPDGTTLHMNIESSGPINLFSGDAWNTRFSYESTLGDTISPQIHESWLRDYSLNRAAGTLDDFRGISPWKRASGLDGLTIDSGENRIDLEIDIHRIVISK